MLQPGARIPDDLLPPAVRVAPGQRLLLYFYPKSDTPACIMEACSFRDNLPLLRAHEAEVVGVSPDADAVQEAFARKYALPFTLLSDADGTLAHAFGVATTQLWAGRTFQSVSRTTFLIDAEGIIHQVWEHVDPRQHVREVVSALDALDAEASRRNLQEARERAPHDVVSPFASARLAEARLADLRRTEQHEPDAPHALDGRVSAAPIDPAQVNAVLDVLRPYMQADGGDVELVGIRDGIVQVRLQGACGTCPSASVTLKLGLEAQLKQRVAGIVAVEAVF